MSGQDVVPTVSLAGFFATLKGLDPSWGPLGPVLGASWRPRGPSWAPLDSLESLSEDSWGLIETESDIPRIFPEQCLHLRVLICVSLSAGFRLVPGWCRLVAASLPPRALGGSGGVSAGARLVPPRCRLVAASCGGWVCRGCGWCPVGAVLLPLRCRLGAASLPLRALGGCAGASDHRTS